MGPQVNAEAQKVLESFNPKPNLPGSRKVTPELCWEIKNSAKKSKQEFFSNLQ